MKHKDTLTYLVANLLRNNKILFDKEELFFQIKSHPSFPSLHSITGVLSHFNIENLATEVPVNKDTLEQLPLSFLAQINTNTGKEFTIVRKLGKYYELTTDSKEKVSISEFLKRFTGIIVVVDKGEEQVEEKKWNTSLVKNITLISTIISFLIPLILVKPEISNLFILILSLIGTFISISIFKQELGESSVLGNAFCSSQTKTKSCDGVLSSKGSKIFKIIKLSDLSLIYFIGMSLSVYLHLILKVNMSVPLSISIIAVPMTIYSIYYQYFIIKKWCFLCLSIVFVLWIQAIISVIKFTSLFTVHQDSLIITGLFFLLVVTLWIFISPLLKNEKEFLKTKISYLKFKKNFSVFNALLEKKEFYETNIPSSDGIVLGNKNSRLNITIITNPFCSHCKVMHKLIQNILKKHNDNVQISIRFNVDISNNESDTLKIPIKLLELFHTKGEQTCLEAMHDIYSGEISTENWLKKWGESLEKEKYIKVLSEENMWCAKNSLHFTPIILINGRLYPNQYDREDLIYFIEELYEKIK